MPNALIIGASRGLGHEFVRQLAGQGWKVFATARNDAALEELRGVGAHACKLDVARPESLAGLGWQLDGESFDLAIYVAGVFGPREGAKSAPTRQDFDLVMHTNVLGAMQALLLVAPMVEAAKGKLVFISSDMASIADASSSYGWIYRSSKAALNMAVRSAASDYPGATFAVLSPGWVRTDMGGENAPLEASESVAGMLDVIAGLKPEESGAYRNYAGKTMPW
ncbi:SDR family oxidoreductase [Noviherbaspirillum galbum]|uniref:SDR family oxidoreductase n=1 Tax=Noviherbaspirillum galbum TaxID=2709383 RepID=A0A6B3SR67_9BURK|nr:SDR family oxidoreductase [Noviherbaspirillum galbum]NEX63253.1 SDR family oxidoreductase [Noviherbaspirillum galbum]